MAGKRMATPEPKPASKYDFFNTRHEDGCRARLDRLKGLLRDNHLGAGTSQAIRYALDMAIERLEKGGRK